MKSVSSWEIETVYNPQGVLTPSAYVEPWVLLLNSYLSFYSDEVTEKGNVFSKSGMYNGQSTVDGKEHDHTWQLRSFTDEHTNIIIRLEYKSSIPGDQDYTWWYLNGDEWNERPNVNDLTAPEVKTDLD